MRDEEIISDGVEIIREGHTRPSYKIPCEICGRKIQRTQYSRKRTYLCDYCKGVIKEKKKIEISDTRTKFDIRFDKAVENIKKQVSDLAEYEKAILIAKKRSYQYGSVPEAMVSIELLKNKFKIIPQQKIGKYRVDFAIPTIKIVLEVDGKTYHTNRSKEAERDYYINNSLGFDWKVIHIPTDYIIKDITKLTKCILECRKTN